MILAVLAYVSILAAPALIAVAGIMYLFVVAPRGSRFLYAAAIVGMAFLNVALSVTVMTQAWTREREEWIEGLAGLCPKGGTRFHESLPVGASPIYRSDTAWMLRDVRELVSLKARDPRPDSGYYVAIRPLPAPAQVFHGILVMREATSGKLIAERVFANVAVNAEPGSNRTREIECIDGSMRETQGSSEKREAVYVRTVSAFLNDVRARSQ